MKHILKSGLALKYGVESAQKVATLQDRFAPVFCDEQWISSQSSSLTGVKRSHTSKIIFTELPPKVSLIYYSSPNQNKLFLQKKALGAG